MSECNEQIKFQKKVKEKLVIKRNNVIIGRIIWKEYFHDNQ